MVIKWDYLFTPTKKKMKPTYILLLHVRFEYFIS